MGDVADLAPRVPGLPPFPGVVDDFEELASRDRQLLLVVGRARVRHLKKAGAGDQCYKFNNLWEESSLAAV